jgi:xanthine dehydrogenase accessory factor
VDAGAVIGWLDEEPILAAISGVLRGLMRTGQIVSPRTKLADIDPRDRPEYCRFISDKALAIGGGALQAIFQYQHSLRMGGKP